MGCSGTYIGSDEHVDDYARKGQIEQLVEYVCKGGEEGRREGEEEEERDLQRKTRRSESRRSEVRSRV